MGKGNRRILVPNKQLRLKFEDFSLAADYMQQKEFSLEIGGRTLSAIFSDLADQANGAVMIRYGETIVLATAVMGKNKREGIDYFPLTVEYEEKFYAAGKIGGGRFIKREGRPSDEAVLSGRIVDRTIRPLFASHIRNEVQVVITVLSIDQDNDPDILGVIGASLALATSDIPWNGPVSAIRLGRRHDESGTFITATQTINPTYGEREGNALDLLICGKDGNISMIEAEGKEVPEETVAEDLALAVTELDKIQAWQKEIITQVGRAKKEMPAPERSAALKALFAEAIIPNLEAAVFGEAGKKRIEKLKDDWKALLAEKLPEEDGNIALAYYEEQVDNLLHREALAKDRRADGRRLDEVRSLFAQAGGLSSIVHGSGIFYRGGTHILTVLTLSGPQDSQLLEGMEVVGKKYFMHHYNFPPFSVGETGRLGGINRRAIGHGALAEKSLRAVLPAREVFPYTIRLVSEALASNGSTSMGSVCASILALMDGGVPITRPVAGIAMGLLSTEGDPAGPYKILTDIQGPEDHYGDMDFKVAGTSEGITGIQLDIKVDGVPVKVLIEAMSQAKKARLEILAVMTQALAAPRPALKESAPHISIIKIPVEKIGAVIGPGGKVIQKIIADTGAQIDIEDDGSVYITGKSDAVAAAQATIEGLTREYKAGERFDGEVTRLMDFGAFVKIGPGKNDEGLVHISELAPFRVDKVTDVVKLGQIVPVIIKEIDEKGRINLSLKAADPDFAARNGAKPGTGAPAGGNDRGRENNRRG